MSTSTLVHLSDLHIGRSRSTDAAAGRLAAHLALTSAHVVVTGDVTHRGRLDELMTFRQLFRPLLDAGRLTVVPGNHDRMGDDVAVVFMPEGRVNVERRSGLYLIKLDSTAPHNQKSYRAHGSLCRDVLGDVSRALALAPADSLVALLLHHHPLPLPEESFVERLACVLGWPHASELALGEELVRRAVGRCDLLLHGHRHVPRERTVDEDGPRPLRIFNAGSSTELLSWRQFRHARGRLLEVAVAEVDAIDSSPTLASPSAKGQPLAGDESPSCASLVEHRGVGP